MKRFVKLICLLVLMLSGYSNVFAWCSGGCDCCPCPGQAQCLGSYSTCEEACGLTTKSGGSGGSGYDNGAALREQQRQESERRAEEQRQRDAEVERQRREADNKRRLEDIEKQAKFLEDRDAAANTLRGSTGIRATTNASGESGLRGSTGAGATSSGSGGTGLRGSSADTGLRGLKTGSTQQPNTDPMVVDARVAPMGADLLAQVPELERSPAADRIRKGFQAIMNVPRDWPVALAWWQEARQRDPNNASLMRAVDLAQWMVNSRNRAAGRPTPTDPVIDAFMRGEATKAIQLINQAKKRNAIQDAEAQRMTNIINKQIKQRAAASKAPKLSPKSATMAQMAAAGDRALSEQMFEDGLLFLNAGMYEQAEQSFQNADFYRPFDPRLQTSSGAANDKTTSKTGKMK